MVDRYHNNKWEALGNRKRVEYAYEELMNQSAYLFK